MRKGEVMVELLLALAIAVIAIVALVAVTTRSIFTSGFSKRQSEATSYAQEVMECVRNKKNEDWANLSNGQAASCATTPVGVFGRTVTFSTLSPQQIQATVTVSWSESGKQYSSKQTTVFTRY